jgi:hypothetical protein
MPGEAHSKSAVEERTRHWLEANYLTALSSLPDATRGVFDGQGQPRNLTAYVFQEVHRKLKIFRWLDRSTSRRSSTSDRASTAIPTSSVSATARAPTSPTSRTR